MIIPYVNQSLPLDQLRDAPAAAAYGLRRLKSGYKGNACIVRRDNDNEELSIPFCGQDLCLSTLRAFVTTNSGFITTWYDQSGNGLNATQATAGNQPRIVNAGVVDVDASGRPRIYFNGSSSVLPIATAGTVLDITSTPLMVNIVVSPESQDGWIVTKNANSAATTQYGCQYVTASAAININLEGSQRTITANNSFPASTPKIYTGIFEGAVQQGYENGNISGNAGNYNGALTSRANMQIGARSNDAGGTAWSIFYKGYISELIIFKSTTGKQRLERNQGKYFQIGVI